LCPLNSAVISLYAFSKEHAHGGTAPFETTTPNPQFDVDAI
jgi:hypothetical protein